jgi:hypothetical protein
MSRWFRVHDDLVDDPKVQLLSGDLVKALLNLWCLASQNDGILPAMSAMAFKLRMKPQQVAIVIAELSNAGLIDRDGDVYRPHNWDKRQYKSDTDKTAADRSKRYRAKHRDGNAPVTRDDDRDANACRERPETEADTEQKQIKKETREAALSRDDAISFEKFWGQWPNKVGKPAALKAYRSAINRSSHAEIIAGVVNYIRDKPPDRPWLNPATFLNQNRWEDQPAQVTHGRDAKTGNIIAASDKLVSIIDSFDAGAREVDQLRGPAGETNVRLLSQG